MRPRWGGALGNPIEGLALQVTKRHDVQLGPAKGDKTISLGLILVIILVIVCSAVLVAASAAMATVLVTAASVCLAPS
jgi:hypothetical protein